VSLKYTRRRWRMQMNMWMIIYLNCGERYEVMIDHRSYIQLKALISQLLKLCVYLQWLIINWYLSLQFKCYDLSYIHLYVSIVVHWIAYYVFMWQIKE